MKKIVCIILVFTGLVLFMRAQEVVTSPTVKEVGGFWYAYMELTATSDTVAEKGQHFLKECRKQSIKSDRAFTIFYTWSKEKGAVIKWDLGYIVPEDTPVKPPLKMKKFEKIKMVVLTHTGSMEVPEITKSWGILDNYMKEKNLKIVWPNYEIHYKNPLRMDLMYRLVE